MDLADTSSQFYSLTTEPMTSTNEHLTVNNSSFFCVTVYDTANSSSSVFRCCTFLALEVTEALQCKTLFSHCSSLSVGTGDSLFYSPQRKKERLQD